MTANEDRPTIAERYSRALESHHLEVKEGRGDVDLLVAAGWVHDGLGTKLYRLRSEWDAVRGEHRLAEAAAQVADKKHTVRVRAVARMAEGDDRAEALQYARDQIAAAERAALTARALIMVHLKTLHAATVALGPSPSSTQSTCATGYAATTPSASPAGRWMRGSIRTARRATERKLQAGFLAGRNLYALIAEDMALAMMSAWTGQKKGTSSADLC